MSDDTDPIEAGRRAARVNRDRSGEPLGVAVFITARELRDMGADPNADHLPYTVSDGRFQVGSEGDDTDDHDADAGAHG